MNRIAFFVGAMGISVLLGAFPALAQQVSLHAYNPNLSLSSPGTSPIQQQIQENYRTQLQGAQREIQQSNPSGLSLEQHQIGQQLNNYNNMGPR